MVDVITRVSIAAPKEKVSQYATDPDNAPAWYKNIESVQWKTSKPLRVGSQVVFKAIFLGKELIYTYEVEKYIPGQQLVMRTSEGPFPMQTTYQWEAIDDHSCLMTLRNTGKPAGFSKLFAPFMEMAMRNANKKDLGVLKAIMEK